MIPLRVFLKNFLCHAEQEFQFEDHPVWLLHGPNGVGKSAVFDAMVYALYGESRRSDSRKNAVVDVIRHGEASMRVEFDFELSGQRFRVWRARVRSGQTKQGVYQWVNGQWTPVRNITSDRDLKQWVSNKLDLTYEAFVTAVLLRQGAAETLIDADKEKRRELFRSLIDLEPYIRLHERVKVRRTEISGCVRQLSARLSGMAIISEEQIAESTLAEQTADEALQKARIAANTARDLLGQSRNWEHLEGTREQLQAALDAAAGRASRSAELASQAARLQRLRVLVPGLRRVDELQNAISTAADAHRQRLEQQAIAAREAEKLATALTESRSQKDECREQVTGFDRQILIGEAEKTRLSGEINRATRAAQLHERLATLKCKRFDPDLDEQLRAEERAVTWARSAKDALPHLELLAGHRNDYLQAVADERAAEQEGNKAFAEVGRLKVAEAGALAESNGAATGLREAERAFAIAEDCYKTAVKRRDDFSVATSKPVCSECLQPIDAKHAARERTKLDQAILDAETRVNTLRAHVARRTSDVDTAKAQYGRVEADRRSAEQRHNDATRTCAECRNRAAQAQRAFANTLKALGTPFVDRVAAVSNAGFPTPDDLITIRDTAEDLPNRDHAYSELRVLQGDREQTARDIRILEESVTAVGAPADVTAALADLKQIEQKLVTLRSSHSLAEDARVAAESAESEVLSKQRELNLRVIQIAGAVAKEEAAIESAGSQRDAAIMTLPEMERATAITVTAEILRTHAEELSQLESDKVQEQFAALADDRVLQADRERQLVQVQEQIARLPADACRPVTMVEGEVKSADAAIREREKLHDTARTQLATLVKNRDLRSETERQLREAERNQTLHERLAGLLGPEGIQLDLVRGAEERIIARANEILVRLSMGDLRFEPPNPESNRAFDLSFRRIDCPEPIAVGNLSGGQRFRVAVSLALAVCQGAGNAVRRLESIIIDEGFGALDRDGRMAMIAELRDGQNLAGMFKRVLVVSHQDDFAAAFPVGYRLRSEGGISKVEPFGLQRDQR